MKMNIGRAVALVFVFAYTVCCSAQSPLPYPKATSDRIIHQKTAMLPLPVNMPFQDPDFGSKMVRATDETTNFRLPGTYLITESSGQLNEWSVNSDKFYVLGSGGQTLAFSFDPTTMLIGRLPNAGQGKALLVAVESPTFSSVDPDLIYGTTDISLLTISSYRFSTGILTNVIDTTKCGTQPPLVRGSGIYSDSLTVSADDNRFVIDEGGSAVGKEPFVIVYDKTLGCRWYNTQTGQIGGQWGPLGNSPIPSFLVQHAYISKSGNYVRIMTYNGLYIWDLSTLNVTSCYEEECYGYGTTGYNTLVNAPGVLDGFEIVQRPLSNLSQITELNMPLVPHNWGQNIHFTWSDVNVSDNSPVCASSYMYGDTTGSITLPFEGEIFCVETDGLASTIWRFAHNRATSIEDEDEGYYYFNSEPLGNVSPDGRFFMFTSNWDAQLGNQSDGTPRSDVWIVNLNRQGPALH